MPKAEFSVVRIGHCLLLILGLEYPPQLTSDGKCFCGLPNYSSEYRRLNCSCWAVQTWAQGHNLTVNALENSWLGLTVVDIDAAMLLQCTHHNSQGLGRYSCQYNWPWYFLIPQFALRVTADLESNSWLIWRLWLWLMAMVHRGRHGMLIAEQPSQLCSDCYCCGKGYCCGKV